MKRILACLLLLLIILELAPMPAEAAVDREANKKIIFDYITKEMKLPAAVACGILANVKAESNFDPAAVGDGGDAYGICQWNSRRDTMVKYCEDNGYGDWKNIEGQLAYLAYELETYKKSVGAYLKTLPNSAQGAYDAAYYFCYYYEIPANRTLKSKQRGTNAVTTYWRDYYGGSVSTYTIRYDANGGTNAPKSQTKTEGIPTLITLDVPTLAGHKLAGWSLKKDASTLDYKEYEEFCINADTTLYAVWERAMEDDTPADASASLNGHTYELYKGSFTWSYANEFAASKGGYLATIETDSEYELVSSLISKADGACWLGGNYGYGNWRWVTGEAFRDDFASSRWASGEPFALYGPTERGKLAQEKDGTWIDRVSSYRPEGFIVEYGETTREIFPMYKLTVDTSLRLREGPGTEFETLNHIYTDEIITIVDVTPGTSTSYNWGWGYTANGKTGWCALRIPNYMIEIGGIDEETGLIYTPHGENGCAIVGYQGSQSEVEIPAYISDFPVIAVLEKAFTGASHVSTVRLSAFVSEVADGSIHANAKYLVPVASDAHAAVSNTSHDYECIFPAKTLSFPDALTEIHEDAFLLDSSIECIDLSNTCVTLIRSGAFASLSSLKYVCLPEGEMTIESGAFDTDTSCIFVVKEGSDAHAWASSSGVTFIAV